MKKKIIPLLLILSISLISAIQINSPETIKQDQTLLVELTANFVNPILKENIILQKEHVRVSSDFQLIFANNIYYLATPLTGKSPGNYSIIIKDASYQQGAEIIDKDIYINFTISEEKADFLLSPGVVYTNKNFEVKLQNLKSEPVTISLVLFEYSPQESSSNEDATVFEALFGDSGQITEKEVDSTSITLRSGEIEFLSFKAEDFKNNSLRKIKFSSANTDYSLPVFVFLNKSRADKPIKLSTRFEPGAENLSMITNSTKTYVFHFFNEGEEDIENITFVVSESFKPYVNLSLYSLENLEKDSSITFEVYVSSPENELSVDGFINAASGDTFLSDSELTLNFIKDYTPPKNEAYAFDDSSPPDNTSKKSSWKFLGIFIVIVIIVLAVWFYFKKFKKASLKPNLLKQVSAKRLSLKPIEKK